MNLNSNNEELVSIIVPIYNIEKYLKKCIESLINQTYKNIEIMLIDDGTPDNSGKIIDEYAIKDNRIVAVHKENGGYGSVLEYGINHIKGKYFLICDGDDYLELDCIEELHKAQISSNYVDLIAGNFYFKYENLDRKEDNGECYKKCNILPNEKRNILKELIFISESPHAKLWKTDIAKNIKFPHKINHTDTLLYVVYLSLSKDFYYIEKPIANYLTDRPGNSMIEFKQKNIKSIKAKTIVHLEILEQFNKNSAISDGIFSRCFDFYIKLLHNLKFYKNEKEYDELEKYLKEYFNELKKSKEELYKVNELSQNKLKNFIKKILLKLLLNDSTTKFAIWLIKMI